MALADLDWVGVLEADEDDTKDITFFMTDGDDAPVAVSCHKLLLSLVSPVFKKMFFGPKKENISSLDISGVSSESVRKMAEFIYQSRHSFTFLGLAPTDLEHMLTLARRYQIDSMEEAVRVAIRLCEEGANPCKNCSEESIASMSVGYCSCCEEYLCQECCIAHTRVRCTKHHSIRYLGTQVVQQ